MSFQVSDESAAREAAPAPGAAGRTPPDSPMVRGGPWRSLVRTRPEYRDYIERTSAFFPRPPSQRTP